MNKTREYEWRRHRTTQSAARPKDMPEQFVWELDKKTIVLTHPYLHQSRFGHNTSNNSPDPKTCCSLNTNFPSQNKNYSSPSKHRFVSPPFMSIVWLTAGTEFVQKSTASSEHLSNLNNTTMTNTTPLITTCLSNQEPQNSKVPNNHMVSKPNR